MPDRDILLRELNHRIKNNFQIIVSLINLKKRMMPPQRREDMRFIEEHVQSMSVAFRQVYAAGALIEVSLNELIGDVVSGLRHIANLNEDQLQVHVRGVGTPIDLDQAIAVSLYLAVVLPPYLDEAATSMGNVIVSAAMDGDQFLLSVRGSRNGVVEMDSLRKQLAEAYTGQIGATLIPGEDAQRKIRFPLRPPKTNAIGH